MKKDGNSLVDLAFWLLKLYTLSFFASGKMQMHCIWRKIGQEGQPAGANFFLFFNEKMYVHGQIFVQRKEDKWHAPF